MQAESLGNSDYDVPSSLRENIEYPRSRHLVFTSAGDKANLHNWTKAGRNFDLWINYYGSDKPKYKSIGDYYTEKAVGKFPALHYAYQNWSSILARYKAILVLDDDIIISGSSICRLFKIREELDLWLIQPAFSPLGKVSHSITRANPFNSLRYVNFVELTCPLFRKDRLDDFMDVYNPELVGWGIDWWFLDTLPQDLQGRVAIVDEIPCINPFDWTKGGKREIDLLQDRPTRIRTWRRIKRENSIFTEDLGFAEYGAVKSSLSGVVIFRAILYSLFDAYDRFKRLLRGHLIRRTSYIKPKNRK